MINVNTDSGILISEFNKLYKSQRDRILGYVEAFSSMERHNCYHPFPFIQHNRMLKRWHYVQKKRIWYSGVTYHVVSRGNRRTAIFKDRSYCGSAVSLLTDLAVLYL